MKNSIIIKQIRVSYIYKLIYPILLILAVYIIGLNSPIISFIQPNILNPEQNLGEIQSNKDDFIQLTVDTLYYSGSDYLVNGKMKGYIYYSLINNFCRFYLIDAGDTQAPEKILYNTTIKGKLIQDEQIFHNLITDVSRELNWTAAGLTDITAPYMVTNIGLIPWNQIVMFGCLALVLLISIIDLIRSLMVICFPSTVLGLYHLRKRGSVKKQILEAENEMNHEDTIVKNGIYLTPNYLIFLKPGKILVIPGDSITWVYIHNRLSRFLHFALNMTYMIHIVIKSGRVFEWPSKEIEDLEFIHAFLLDRYPEIITGYSEKNKRLAREARRT